MLHARLVRPAGQAAYGAGAVVQGIDEQSIAGIGDARVLPWQLCGGRWPRVNGMPSRPRAHCV
jgi:hypothetical protein